MLYLVMTHIGTSFIAAAFWLLFLHSGTFSFAAFHAHAATLPPVLKNTIFVCALIGFGTKAGVIPLHIWLPEAHPQAPSHVSALMSGVMIKTAIYGILRFLFGFLDEIPPWWGTTILTIAIVSTLLGILYALMENDLKRLLAFSSIENIGIILLGLGMGMVFKSMGNSLYASFAITAALFHTLNHAIFKGLLFLASGAVLSKTHTRNIEHLGGLIRRMPWTAALFLVGALSISALPPLNGFISEWMTFMALLLGFEGGGVGIRFFSPLLAALLGLAGALAATCFVKAFGVTFLGEARSNHSSEVCEVGNSMKIGMGILAASCLGLAVAAPWVVGILGKVSRSLMGDAPVGIFARKTFLLPPSGVSQISPLAIGVILMLVIPFSVVTIRLILGKRSLRIGPSWDCGLPGLAPRMQYTATGYSKPLRRIFSFLYQPTRRVELEDEGHEILRTAERFESKISHIVDDRIYKPAAKLVSSLSQKAKQIQTGHIQLYLAYIFITLILLLLFGSRL
jgi:hydrogenase-4 component B